MTDRLIPDDLAQAKANMKQAGKELRKAHEAAKEAWRHWARAAAKKTVCEMEVERHETARLEGVLSGPLNAVDTVPWRKASRIKHEKVNG